MRLTGSTRLIKSDKMWWQGVHKERAKGRKAYNGGQEAIRERKLILDVSLLQPTSSLLVVQVACWAYAPNKER